DRFAYVLCRTSNPGAGELQALSVVADPATGAPEEPLAHRVARRVAGWSTRPGTVGPGVGASAPDEPAAVRALAHGMRFLGPGIGAQGGDIAGALAHGPATAAPGGLAPGGALLVNASRGISAAAIEATGPGEALRDAALAWAGRLRV